MLTSYLFYNGFKPWAGFNFSCESIPLISGLSDLPFPLSIYVLLLDELDVFLPVGPDSKGGALWLSLFLTFYHRRSFFIIIYLLSTDQMLHWSGNTCLCLHVSLTDREQGFEGKNWEDPSF